MRSSSKSRSRSKGSSRNRNVGNIINRVFDSAGPESKVRGTPQQIIEKYQTLTRDAQLSGDRVAAENFQQHAEHYLRMLNESQREQADRQAAEARNRSPQQQDQGGDGGGQDQRQDRQDQRQDRQQDRGGPNDDRQARGEGDQPDIAPVIDARDEESGLVETPESKTGPKPEGKQPARGRGRTRRPAKGSDNPGDEDGQEQSKQAEATEGSAVS